MCACTCPWSCKSQRCFLRDVLRSQSPFIGVCVFSSVLSFSWLLQRVFIDFRNVASSTCASHADFQAMWAQAFQVQTSARFTSARHLKRPELGRALHTSRTRLRAPTPSGEIGCSGSEVSDSFALQIRCTFSRCSLRMACSSTWKERLAPCATELVWASSNFETLD